MPNCQSHELYKGILDGKGRGVFNGKILVRQDAQKTDAKQTNQTLLLSTDAQINTKPRRSRLLALVGRARSHAHLWAVVTHQGHRVYTINYHIVWCPKYRRKVLVGPVRQRLLRLPRRFHRPEQFLVALEIGQDGAASIALVQMRTR